MLLNFFHELYLCLTKMNANIKKKYGIGKKFMVVFFIYETKRCILGFYDVNKVKYIDFVFDTLYLHFMILDRSKVCGTGFF